MARPKPCAPPVTIAQRLLRSILFIGNFLRSDSCVVDGLLPRPALRGERVGWGAVSANSARSSYAEAPPHPDRKGDPTSPRKRGEVTLKRPAAIDDVRDAGGEGALVAGEIDGERCDLLGGAEPAHRLP